MIYEGHILRLIENEITRREEDKVFSIIKTMTDEELKAYKIKMLEIVNRDKAEFLRSAGK